MNLVSTGLKKYKGNFWKVHYDDKNHFLKLLNMLNVFKKPYKHFVRPSWTIRLTTVRQFMFGERHFGKQCCHSTRLFFRLWTSSETIGNYNHTSKKKKKRKPVQKTSGNFAIQKFVFFLDEYTLCCIMRLLDYTLSSLYYVIFAQLFATLVHQQPFPISDA
jgi:hypothetical protein